jgi:hypothetical protein
MMIDVPTCTLRGYVGSNPTLSAHFVRFAGRLLSAAWKHALLHLERGFY